MISHRCYIWRAFLQCEYENGQLNLILWQMTSHTRCTRRAFLQCELEYVSSVLIFLQTCFHKCHTRIRSLQFLVAFGQSFCSSECLWKCFVKCDFFMKAFLHSVHRYGFCPVCVRKCVISLDFVTNLFLHTVHLHGFCPVCFALICSVRVSLCVKSCPHSVQWWGFIPVWHPGGTSVISS